MREHAAVRGRLAELDKEGALPSDMNTHVDVLAFGESIASVRASLDG